MKITLYTAENSTAFWRKSDKLYTQHNGNYLDLLQLLAKFDPVMQDRISCVLKGESADHDCGKISNG
jgi:hypothetical protein